MKKITIIKSSKILGCALCIFLMMFSSCKKENTTIVNTATAEVRYKESVFSNIVSATNIIYGSNTTYSGTIKTLSMDIYYPDGDTATKRPLLILVPGGGFSSMTNKTSFADFAKAIAKYGYVVVSINYRTYDGTDIMSNSVLKQILLQGMQDTKAAIRFFRKDAATTNTYKINSDKIFLGGHSAGGMVAAHTVYMNDINKADAEFQTVIAANGGLEGSSGNSGYSSIVTGNINLSGSLLDKNYITATSKPMLGIYGTTDNLMPFNDGTFSLQNILSINVSGVNSLYTKAKATGILKNSIYAISGGDHFSSAQVTCSDCLSAIANFMYNLI